MSPPQPNKTPATPRSLVIIPTYNEVESAPALVTALTQQYANIEVVVVDDGSPDGTADTIDTLRSEGLPVHVLRRESKQGLGAAYLAGFRFGLDHGFTWLFTMDGDQSHDPRELGAMLDALEAHDMVIGSRYVPGGGISNWPFYRRWLSSTANWFTRTLLDLRYRDCTSGYRGYRREVLEAIDVFAIQASGYSFLEQIVWRVDSAGFSVAEVPIRFTDRQAGASKIATSEIFKAAWDVIASRRERRDSLRD